MSATTLHITNGSNLTDYLNELGYKGDFLTWHEMLCEGPTTKNIDSEEFLNLRKSFLNDCYDVEVDEYEYKTELHKLNDLGTYSEIVLWFEYDLFCHINLIAVISLLQQKNCTLPLYLVCSGRIPGENDLKGLSELSPEQLEEHYKNRTELSKKDIDLAITIWEIYCGHDHNLLKPYIVESSSFKYLSNCLKAHLKRFPNQKNGLSTLEENILTLVRDEHIKSQHHLLGYALNYQGFYGFGDIQLRRMINKLNIFFTHDKERLHLNREGHEALINHHNFARTIANNMHYGGVNRSDFQFCTSENKLVKTIINAN